MNKNKFKIGLFAFNASGGVTLTKNKQKWSAAWKDIKKISIDADNFGMDFLLPVARWNDWGGVDRPHKNTFETLTMGVSYKVKLSKAI